MFSDVKCKKPILVTGSPRSGSTWVGNIIAESPLVLYINEPFLPTTRHSPKRVGVCGAKFDKWFTYICDQNESNYYKYFQKTSKLSYNVWESLYLISGLSTAKVSIEGYQHFLRGRIKGARPLFKDPIAVFSAEWLWHNFDMDVVVLIRHPLAFVSSIKKAKWKFPLSDILEQPLLIKDYLSGFEAEIRGFISSSDCDFVDLGILLWKLIYYVVAEYREKYKNWIFLRYEDLASDPLEGFSSLFNLLDLKYTKNIKDKITYYNHLPPITDREIHPLDINRNTAQNLSIWHTRLTGLEIDKIRKKTKNIAQLFYPDWTD